MEAYVLDNMTLRTKDILEYEDYTFAEDLDYSEGSSIQSSKRPNIADDDFVICKNGNDIDFIGICYDYKTGNGEDYRIKLKQKENFFDRNIFKDNADLISTLGIEDFVARAIEDNWVNSGDTLVDKAYLTTECLTHTMVGSSLNSLSGTESSSQTFNFKTFLGNAKQYHKLYLRFVFDFSIKQLKIQIYVDSATAVPVDATCDDVVGYEETYDVDVLAKLTVRWKRPDGEEGETYDEMSYVKGNGTFPINQTFSKLDIFTMEVRPTGDCWLFGSDSFGARVLSGQIILYFSSSDTVSTSYASGDDIKVQIGSNGRYIFRNGKLVASSETAASSGNVTFSTIGVNGTFRSFTRLINGTDNAETFKPVKRRSDSKYGILYSNGDAFFAPSATFTGTITGDVSTFRYFLVEDPITGEKSIVSDSSDARRVQGTIESIYIESDSAEDMYQSAVNEFSRNRYEHKIGFNLLLNSKVYPSEEYYVGRSTKIKTKDGVRESVVTKSTITNTSAFLSLVYGKLAVNLTEKLKEALSK